MRITDLTNIEESQLLMTAGGHTVDASIDNAMSIRLTSLWNEIGIDDIEQPSGALAFENPD